MARMRGAFPVRRYSVIKEICNASARVEISLYLCYILYAGKGYDIYVYVKFRAKV